MSRHLVIKLFLSSGYKFKSYSHKAPLVKFWVTSLQRFDGREPRSRQGLRRHPDFNTLRPRRNEQHFADDIFKRIFFNENVWIAIEISLTFVPKGPINSTPALVQIMAWRRSGDKPLCEPMMFSLPTHICVTRAQWVKFPTNEEFIHWDLN